VIVMQRLSIAFVFLSFYACSGGGGGAAGSSAAVAVVAPSSTPSPSATRSPGVTATSTPATTATPPGADARLTFATGFYANVVANVPGARELFSLPDGDLLVGTTGTSISIVPKADAAGLAGKAATFATLSEGPAESVILAPNGNLYVATNTNVWQLPYRPGDQSESGATSIARVRTGAIAPHSDGDVHRSTSVAATATTLYVGVGSSCNACVEVDPTRAVVLRMPLAGGALSGFVTRSRNPIVLAVNPATGSLWIGGAGQDDLTYGHPYEYFDSPTLRGASVDYGWPACEENHHAYNPLGAAPTPSCASTVAPVVEFPAYSTLVGAAFYPLAQLGAYAFPAAYRGGAFVTSHGSWHCCPSTPPRVYYVPMRGDVPSTAVSWSDPTVQSIAIVSGYGSAASSGGYIGRPTGVAVGSNGSLFVADDQTGNILRIRHR
jgi:glucose/arabinose dehydrogenase